MSGLDFGFEAASAAFTALAAAVAKEDRDREHSEVTMCKEYAVIVRNCS